MNRQKNFEKRMLATGSIPNISAAVIILVYVVVFAGLTIEQILQAGVAGLCVIAFLQLVVAPLTNRMITRKISEQLEEFENGETTIEDRTSLLQSLMSCPLKIAIEVLTIFATGTMVWCACFYFVWDVSGITTLLAILACLYGTVNAGILGLNYAERLCSPLALSVVQQGIDDTFVKSRRFFGLPAMTLYVIYIWVPLLFTNLISFLFFFVDHLMNDGTGIGLTSRIVRMAVIIVCNTGVSFILSNMLFKRIRVYIQQMTDALTAMETVDVTTAALIPTDFSNEISYNIYLINRIIMMFRGILMKASGIAEEVMDSSRELIVMSGQTASTSLEQSSSVKEIVATMEDSGALSRNISEKVGEVAIVANKTTSDVEEGFETLKVNLDKMSEITDANMVTISGIKSLSEQIETIWEIVKIINSIADQTKIIAFNAELEAASAGEAGRNFHIVANEIRRLADGTMESTKEIKKRITEVQHSSDNLIVTSEGGTEKIREGCELSATLSEKFSNIRTSSEITAESAGEIKLIIEQQTAAFEQILLTLRQISEGVEMSSGSTQTISRACGDLKNIADSLRNLAGNSDSTVKSEIH
jgi:methyl-accepting chemotaxis protein